MKKEMIMLCGVLCLMGCAPSTPNEPQDNEEVMPVLSDEEKALQVALDYCEIEEMPKEEDLYIVKEQYTLDRAGLVFKKEMQENEEYYFINIDHVSQYEPYSRCVLVSATTFEVIGYGLYD